MNSVQRIGVYAFYFSLSVISSSDAVFAKENKEGSIVNSSNNTTGNVSGNNRASTAALVSEFQWDEHRPLSWNDFQGKVNAVTDESAAATHCGIGFRTTKSAVGNKPGIIVYNTFYVNKSWVKPDAKMPEILTHEQGHFDLCELYTRVLRSRLSGIDLNVPDLKAVLERIYFDVKNEYELRQQAYESQTIHGTNFTQQGKWHDIIARELRETGVNKSENSLAFSAN